MTRSKVVAVWVLTILCTACLLVYQRVTGPTYPIRVHSQIGGAEVSGKLIRTHFTNGPASVEITAPQAKGSILIWRLYPTQNAWSETEMVRRGDVFSATLPQLPQAGKVEYYVKVTGPSGTGVTPAEGSAILRYKGETPAWLVVIHVLFMFLGPFFAFRAATGLLFGDKNPSKWLPALVFFLSVGGFILGPWMQLLSFGALWTGWPVGEDLTDTKTLIAIAGWIVAFVADHRQLSWNRYAFWGAMLIMLTVFIIPHSVRGSQIDWSKQSAKSSK